MTADALKKILDAHAEWLKDSNTGAKANLSGADLSEANLRWANLSEADLREADLRWADLSGANLRGANLRWANLRGANLREADLSGADLRWANLSEATGLEPTKKELNVDALLGW